MALHFSYFIVIMGHLIRFSGIFRYFRIVEGCASSSIYIKVCAVYFFVYFFFKFDENFHLDFNCENQLQKGLQPLRARHVGSITSGIQFLIYYELVRLINGADMTDW